MKNKTKIVLLVISLLLVGMGADCQTRSLKRGFCGNPLDFDDLAAVGNLTWFYNWGQDPTALIQDTVKYFLDYCPMIWGKGFDETGLRDYLSEHPEIKYLLGFNEPNFIEQANMGPREAAALWPEIEQIADDYELKLVSPALNFAYPGGAVTEEGIEYTDPIQYLDDFFEALPPGSRVDYVAIHGYFDNAGALPWYIGLYEKYGKPLWLTEFNHSAGYVDETSQQNYMVEALDYLENEPDVFRYAWFLDRSEQTNTNLFESGTTGVLTNLGLIYANMSSYDTTYFNGTEQVIEAEHFTDMQGIHLIAIEDTGGIIAAHDFDPDDWMEYQLRVEEGKAYVAQFRFTSVWESSFSLYDGETLLRMVDIPVTGGVENWETLSVPLDLSQGEHKIRILCHGGGWRLNWWRITSDVLLDIDENQPDETEKVTVFPNPVSPTKKLTIQTPYQNYACKVVDLQGRTILNYSGLSRISVIDVSSLEAGYYRVVINSGNDICSKPIVVK